jgi:predicted dehydrogenase
MAYVAGHLSVAALEERYQACEEVMSSHAFPGDLATGERSFDRRGGVDDLVWAALDRRAGGALQCAWTFGDGRSASRQRGAGEGSDGRTLATSALTFGRTAARRWGLDERQGRGLDGGRTGAGLACAAARLGGAAGDQLVDPEAATAQLESGDARRARSLQKNSPRLSPRKRRAIPPRRSRPSRPTNTGSA